MDLSPSSFHQIYCECFWPNYTQTRITQFERNFIWIMFFVFIEFGLILVDFYSKSAEWKYFKVKIV